MYNMCIYVVDDDGDDVDDDDDGDGDGDDDDGDDDDGDGDGDDDDDGGGDDDDDADDDDDNDGDGDGDGGGDDGGGDGDGDGGGGGDADDDDDAGGGGGDDDDDADADADAVCIIYIFFLYTYMLYVCIPVITWCLTYWVTFSPEAARLVHRHGPGYNAWRMAQALGGNGWENSRSDGKMWENLWETSGKIWQCGKAIGKPTGSENDLLSNGGVPEWCKRLQEGKTFSPNVWRDEIYKSELWGEQKATGRVLVHIPMNKLLLLFVVVQK